MSTPSDEARYKALFLEESQELLDGFLNCLFVLEQQPADLAPVDEIFRVAHTLKGMAGAMGYGSVAEFCHRAENHLDRWRQDRAPISTTDLEFMFQVESALRDMTTNLEDLVSHQGALGLFADTPMPAERAPSPAAGTSPVTVEAGEVGLVVTLEEEVAYPRLRFKMVSSRLEKLGSLVRSVPGPEEWEALAPGAPVTFVVTTEAAEDALTEAAASVGEVALVLLVDAGEPADVEGGSPTSGIAEADGVGIIAARPSAPAVHSYQQTGIRVERKKLDRITNMVGEILMFRRRLKMALARYDDEDLNEILEQIERTSLELEREVLSARMVPVGSIFQRFQRLVRELSDQLGKEVDAEFQGGDTEIDRSLLDRIQEPLVHIIRNSLDHGLETPEEREAGGKPRRGSLVVTAALEHGNVALKVEDDGRGIDPERVLAAARRKGVIAEDSGQGWSRAQVFSLLFQAGFSTAEQVTSVSGRGVGLDVVRKKVVEVGGDINLISDAGQGTKVILEFPPTLSLLRSLIVRAGDVVVGVPQNQVFRIARLEREEISWVKGSPMVVVDETPVPVRSLAGLLGRGDPLDVESESWMFLVKLSSRIDALAISGLIGDQELVIKPLMRSLSRAPGLVGTSVVADGRLALFVDLRLLLLQRGAGVEA
ncbi:MAG: chemotaxis protein CheA [Thermoleophilia bacterium]